MVASRAGLPAPGNGTPEYEEILNSGLAVQTETANHLQSFEKKVLELILY